MSRISFPAAIIAVAIALGQTCMADLLFDNGNHVETGAVSDDYLGNPFNQSDFFTLPSSATITAISWKGFYFNNPTPAVDNFQVFIYSDDGTGEPTSSPQASAIYSSPAFLTDKHLTGETLTFLDHQPFYQYTANINAFNLTSGTKYWLEIYNNEQADDWHWAIDLNVPGRSQFYNEVSDPNTWHDNTLNSITTFQLFGNVPEPSTLALLTLGGVIAFAAKRH
jgi:hypothetical protein